MCQKWRTNYRTAKSKKKKAGMKGGYNVLDLPQNQGSNRKPENEQCRTDSEERAESGTSEEEKKRKEKWEE
jgi:hypothetical protein